MRVCEMNFEGLSENRVGVEGNILLETAILEVEGSTHFLYRPYSSLRWKIYAHVFDPVLDF
jgi:hypothetical protein